MSGAQDLPRQLEQARQLARLRQLRERNLVSGTGRLLRLPDPDGLRKCAGV